MQAKTPHSFLQMSGRRWVGVALLAAAALLTALVIAFARMLPATAAMWTQWLQNAVNVIRLLEVTALAFGAYQFWANRNELRAAEAEACGEEKEIIPIRHSGARAFASEPGIYIR